MSVYAYTILYVNDVERAMQFYQQAFGLQLKFITPEKDYGELQTGSTTLAFGVHSLTRSNLSQGYTESRPDQPPFGVELGFTTEDVTGTVEKALAAGATEYEASVVKPWGQTVAYLRDPEGFLIEVCTPMGA